MCTFYIPLSGVTHIGVKNIDSAGCVLTLPIVHLCKQKQQHCVMHFHNSGAHSGNHLLLIKTVMLTNKECCHKLLLILF